MLIVNVIVENVVTCFLGGHSVDPASLGNKALLLRSYYWKYHSVTSMLIELGLPSFDTLIINSRVRLSHQCQSTQNGIIGHICRLYSV